MAEIITQYKFETNKDRFGLARKDLFKALQGQSLYNEFSQRQTRRGRDGDMGVESANYDLFFGGRTASWFDGRLVAVYQTNLECCNGSYETLSVLMQSHKDKPFEQKVHKLFDDLEFAPRHSYLQQGDNVTWRRTFTKWMDAIYVPEEKPFQIR